MSHLDILNATASGMSSRDVIRPRPAAHATAPGAFAELVRCVYVCDKLRKQLGTNAAPLERQCSSKILKIKDIKDQRARSNSSFDPNLRRHMPAGSLTPASQKTTRNTVVYNLPPCPSCGRRFTAGSSPNARATHASRCRQKQQQLEHHATVPALPDRMWKARGFHVFWAEAPVEVCAICNEEWSATCVRAHLPCGCARACLDCIKRWRATKMNKKTKKWFCPFGCGIGFPIKYRPVALGNIKL